MNHLGGVGGRGGGGQGGMRAYFLACMRACVRERVCQRWEWRKAKEPESGGPGAERLKAFSK